jgi:hypothetical protein
VANHGVAHYPTMKKDKVLPSSDLEFEMRQLAKSIEFCQRAIAQRFHELGAYNVKEPSLPVIDFLIEREKQLNQELLFLLDTMEDYKLATPAILTMFEGFEDRFINLLDILERCKSLQTVMCQLPLLFQRLEEVVIDRAKAAELEQKYDSIAYAYRNLLLTQLEPQEIIERIHTFEYQIRLVVSEIVSQFIIFYQKNIDMWYRDNSAAGFEALVNDHHKLLVRMLDKVEVTPEGLINLKRQLRSLDKNLKFSVEDLKRHTKLKLGVLGGSINIGNISELLAKYRVICPARPKQTDFPNHSRNFRGAL